LHNPDSAGVVQLVREELPKHAKCKVVALKGNHEDGWLRTIDGGWPEFIVPYGNGCAQTYRSYIGEAAREDDPASREEYIQMADGGFFPPDVVAWMRSLPYYYEDDNGIYVHAGLVEGPNDTWLHPRDTPEPAHNLWLRSNKFFKTYRGKTVVIGHTSTDYLPPELSQFTPDDPLDMWVRDELIAIDTGCGKGGFLTCVELPSMKVYESR
jgi:serine/threonine protein phosphatase 1